VGSSPTPGTKETALIPSNLGEESSHKCNDSLIFYRIECYLQSIICGFRSNPPLTDKVFCDCLYSSFPMLSEICLFEAFLQVIEGCVACSPVASFVKLKEDCGFYLVIGEHEFTFDTFRGYSYILWDYFVFQLVHRMEMTYKADETLLLKYLGSSPTLRIIDFFLDNPLSDYSKNEVAADLAMSRVTFFKYWKELEKSGALIVTRKIGKATMYKLDRTNEIVKQLIILDMTISRKMMEKQVKEAEKPITIKTD